MNTDLFDSQFYNNMDISQFESLSNNALLQIQRAQRVLDQAQLKMKRFKQQKKQAMPYNKLNLETYSQPFSNIKQYLAYFINDQQQNNVKHKANPQISGKQQSYNKYLNQENQLQNFKKTQKVQMKDRYQKQTNRSRQIKKTLKIDELAESFDFKKHTQDQLQKSQLIHLQRIEAFYKQNCDQLDRKLKQLQKNREKIRKDKVLLMRNNEELEQKINELRGKRQQFNEKEKPQSQLSDKMNRQISRQQKKLAKIQMQNNKIIKRKQDLQTNMRVCIRNSKQNIQGDIVNLGYSQNKPSNKCPYH